MAFSLLPASALAANEGTELKTEVSTSENSPVQVKKSVNADGNALTLEAYVTNEVTQTSSTKPLDIVLVLDQSGSMADDFNGRTTTKNEARRQYAMKQAVNSFIEKATSADGTHNMAIVTFGTDAEVLNSGWTKVDTKGAQALTNAINGLSDKPTGATNVGVGMQKAQELMNSAKSDTNRQKVVIVFTDGVPTTTNEFNIGVANSAITAAKSMKDTGVTVYTVGIFNGANPNEMYGASGFDTNSNGTIGSKWAEDSWGLFPSTDFPKADRPAGNRFLNLVSSNYPNADSIGLKRKTSGLGILHSGISYTVTKNFDRAAEGGYYLTADSSSNLNTIFQQIIEEISTLKIVAGTDAVLSDTLSEYFTFDGATAEDPSKIIVKTAEVNGVYENGAYTWKEAKDYDDAVVTVTGKKLEVTGFDYTANAVTKTTNRDGVSYSGSKLIVTIPIKPDTTCTAWQAGERAYPTNSTAAGSKAGLSGYTDKEGKPLETVLNDSPEAKVTAYTVTYNVTGAPDEKSYVDSRAYITGQSASVLAAPTSPVEKDGFTYTFTGWLNGTENVGDTIVIEDHNVILTGTWNKIPVAQTGKVIITKQVVDADGNDLIPTGEFTFNAEKGAEIVASGSLHYDDTKLTTATIDLEAGSYNLSEDLTTAKNAVPGYELESVRFAETGKERESAVQTDTDDFTSRYGDYKLTITADKIAYVTCINTYKKTETAPTTGNVVITKQVEGVDAADLTQIKELTFNAEKGVEIVGHDSLRYDGTKLTTATINLEEGSYNLSEDLNKAMNAIPGYELVGVRFAETGKESESAVQTDTDDFTSRYGDYKLTITADKVVFVTCINTYEKKEVKPDTYTVTYTDGANGTVFENQVYTDLHAGDKTPAFNGTPTRSGYTFNGWTPDVAKTVTGNAIYKATWTKNSGGRDDDSDTYYLAVLKVDAQDGHALKNAKFGLYVDDKQIATATSSSEGYALFSLDERVYNKLDEDDEIYYTELTAPEGYIKSSREYTVSVDNFVKNSRASAKEKAKTVKNTRTSTPDRLNDDEHFAYVIGYKDGNVRPYGLISRAETTTIFFRLLKDSVRDGNLLTSNTFTDVADDYWANTAISTMTGLGIVQGRTATTFDPKAPITRAQFAAICARFDDGKTKENQSFTDIKGHWAEQYIVRAAELGWIKGFEDGSFRPDAYITRAQAMTMINRVLNRIPEENSDLRSGMNVWPDCNPGDWFYLAVQEATNSHDYKHKAGNYEKWTSMNKDPDWTRYEN